MVRPYYLLREFSHVIAIMTYIPPSASQPACFSTVLWHSFRQSILKPFLITGDLNHASLSATLPNFHQYVNCCTRDNKTLDLLYAITAAHQQKVCSREPCCRRKGRAFQSGDRDELRRVQRDLKRKIKECKASYRRKMEDHLQQNNARECFQHHPPLTAQGEAGESGASDQLAAWVTNYLTDRPQFVRLQDCVSDVVVCSTGAPQGTVLSPFLFTLYTSDFTYSTDSCHLQKFSDNDTAIVGCVSEGNDCEYRKVIMDFVDWCELNHLQVNASKTKEMVIDFSRKPSSDIAPVNIQGLDIERVRTYKYLGVDLNNKLDWTDNTDSLYKE
ncbi:hypothetical protein L3Q82_016830, partial [Scortum barcoo]